MRLSRRERGFTLVELLVVITIIGILISLLLPAVQAAREAARRAQCNNNMKQLGLACLNHESALKRMPTGGWHALYIGSPDIGAGMRQTGGWLFNILPYIEQSSLYMLQGGKSGTNLAAAGSTLMATPVSAFYCPSRRQAKAYPQLSHKDTTEGFTYDAGVACMVDSCNERVADLSTAYATTPNYARSEVSSMSDYAGNSYGWLGGNRSWGDARTYQMDVDTMFGTKAAQALSLKWRDSQADNYLYPGDSGYTDGCGKGGIFYPFSTVEIQDIKDGTSNTIMAGEKYLMPDHYEDGKDHGDCWCCWIGFDTVTCRWVQYAGTPQPLRRDTPGAYLDNIFGSCHAGGANFTMCDGSVRQVSYGIDSTVFMYLGHRGDGHPIDATSLSF